MTELCDPEDNIVQLIKSRFKWVRIVKPNNSPLHKMLGPQDVLVEIPDLSLFQNIFL